MYRSDSPATSRHPYTNLYAKLGVSSEASAEEIRSAYAVLEEAYRPGGAYVDDAMHLALSEISNAAAILGNPKSRHLYDLGYIDETGKPTKAGLAARAGKVRTALVGGASVAVALAGFALFTLMGDKPNEPAVQKTETAAKDQHSQEAKLSVPPQAAPPVAAPRPPEPASNPVLNAQPPKPAPPVQADARDYLPPAQMLAPRRNAGPSPQTARTATPRLSLPPKTLPAPRKTAALDGQTKPAEGPAPNLERKRMARFSKTAPQMLQSYIWFGGPAPGPIRASQSLKSAHCLACLMDHEADCSRACR